MKVLVTGAAGFIGFHLCRYLATRGHQVVGIDSLNDYYDPTLKRARLLQLGIGTAAADLGRLTDSPTLPGLSFARVSLEDRPVMDHLFATQTFDRVCHLAAQAGVRYSLRNPRAYVEANVVGFLNVLEGCREAGVKHLVFASSSSVYGLSQRRPFSEHSSTDHPVSLYAATKKADELMAHAYAHLYGVPATGLRFFTVYGPWGRPDMAYYIFAVSIAEGRAIQLFNSGDMIRDFTYVDDVIKAVSLVLDRPAAAAPDWDPSNPDPAISSAPYRLYNVGNGRAEPVANLVSALERGLGLKADRVFAAMQPGDVLATEADVADLRHDFGWTPATSLETGIARFVEWFKTYHAGEPG